MQPATPPPSQSQSHSHSRLPSILHRAQTSRVISGSGSSSNNSDVGRVNGSAGRSATGDRDRDDVLRDYEEKRDRLHASLTSSSSLLADLRTFNSSWNVRYPVIKPSPSSSASSSSSSKSSSTTIPGAEDVKTAGGDKKREQARRTLTMTFADDPTSAQEVEVTTAPQLQPQSQPQAQIQSQSHGRSQSAVTQAVAGVTACGPDVKVKRKTLRRSLTVAPSAAAQERLENGGVLGVGNEEVDDMTEFSILRLDLSFGHGQSVTTQVGGIITSLEKNSISRLLSSRFEHALNHINSLQARIMSTRSRVLVTGDLNAGKSTFVNALLRRGGRDEDGWPSGVMPVDQQPLTGRFVEVFGGEQGVMGEGEVEEVHVIKGREEEYDPKDEGTFRRVKVEELMDLVAEQEAEQPPLKVYLKEPRKDLLNPSILHNGILDISLIDAPGLNRDVIPTTSTFTRSPTIDVIIFVVSASNHFTLSAKEFILSAGQEKARMFVVVNRFDEVRDKEKCKRVVLEQIRQLSPKTWEEREELVHFVDSAKVALRCGEMIEAEGGEAEKVDEAFKGLESSLRSFVLINRAKSKLGPAENYLCHLLADVDLLASANAVVAEDERDRAREEKERVRPGLEVMLKGSHGLEENLGEEEEKIGGVVDNKVKSSLGNTLNLIGRGQVSSDPESLPPYPGLLGVWDYAIEVRKAMLRSIELAVGQLEDDTRKITAETVKKVGELQDEYLPKDVIRSNRVFNPQAMFTAGLAGAQQPGKLARRKSTSVATVGLGLASRSELSAVSLADIFDIHHYVTSAKATLTGQSKAEDGHDGELTVLGMASLAAGAVTMFGGKAMGVRHAIESVVSLGEILENKAARRWAGPIVGAVVLGLAAYIVQDLPASIPRNIGRQIHAALESSNASMFLGDGYDGTYTNAQSARLQKEARKVIRLASWDLRERFRAALEEKHKIVKESEEQEKKAAEALEYFVEVQKRVLGIKGEMGKSVFA